MAITVEERATSREGEHGKSEDRVYLVKGTCDPDAAVEAVLAVAPGNIDNLVRNKPRKRALLVSENDEARSLWEITIPYALGGNTKKDPPSVGDIDLSFDFRMSSRHVTYFLPASYRGYSATGVNPPDFGGAINFDGESIQGVDIPGDAGGTLSASIFIPDAQLTQAYIDLLWDMVNESPTNAAAIWGYGPEELWLTHVNGTLRGDLVWRVAFEFAKSKSATNLPIPGPLGAQITVAEKKGWEYLWIYYQRRLVATNDDPARYLLVQAPYAAYVGRVVAPGDYSLLGLEAIRQQGGEE